jgi:hypothetical protein
MSERDRKAAEATFDKRQKRESEIAGVLIQENARRDAAVKNMQRLRALRIERDAKKSERGESQKARLMKRLGLRRADIMR